MDSDADELVQLLLSSKLKIWEDKKRLGLLEEGMTPPQSPCITQNMNNAIVDTPRRNFCVHEDIRERKKEELIAQLSSDSLSFGKQEDHVKSPQKTSPLPEDLRKCEKENLICKLTSTGGLLGLGEKAEEEIERMVRFGEYSPQNPNLLSPGKTLLGLGEYEEKRKQILERKKREYLGQMTQARHDAVNGRLEKKSQQEVLGSSPASLRSSGTQTDLQITGYVQDAGFSPTVGHGGMFAQSPRVEISDLSPYSHTTNVSTQTSGGNVKFPKYVAVSPLDNSVPVGVATLPQPSSYLPLSPRERKLAEFRESYSPSFLPGPPLRQGEFDMSLEKQPDLRRRREAYQEELRRQIEEKRRLDAEQQEKERQEEAAITSRAELQRERMRQEYIQEEALRRERHIQRMRQAEEFQRKQEALKLEAELEREAEARRKLEKRLRDLEVELAQHTSCSSQSLGVSLPVPALRSKVPASMSPKAASPPRVSAEESHGSISREARAKDRDIANIQSVGADRQQESTPESVVHSGGSERLIHSYTSEYSPPVDSANYPRQKSNADHSLPTYSGAKAVSEPVTISYHRPPTEVIKAAGYTRNYRKHSDDESALSLRGPGKKCLDLPSDVQRVSPAQQEEEKLCRKKLEDSLPVPILRAPSPVIPAVRLSQAGTSSDAMRKLEGKWQVPAVEKNVVNADSNSILTQLGAVRHQLQLEQMRMEQHLQQKLKNKS